MSAIMWGKQLAWHTTSMLCGPIWSHGTWSSRTVDTTSWTTTLSRLLVEFCNYFDFYNELRFFLSVQVIFTDGETSFCLMNYFNLTWPNTVHRASVKIGLNIDTFQNVFIENNRDSEFSPSMNQDILNKLVQRSNINFEHGKWLFRLDKRGKRINMFLVRKHLKIKHTNNSRFEIRRAIHEDLCRHWQQSAYGLWKKNCHCWLVYSKTNLS